MPIEVTVYRSQHFDIEVVLVIMTL